MGSKYRYFVGDFETTVYDGQDSTEVWASGLCEMYTEDAIILHSIGETFDYLTSLKSDVIVYYHNLKFDGAFWLSYLITQLNYKQAYEEIQNNGTFSCRWLKNKEMPKNSFKYSISDKGQWYTITIRYNNFFIEIRDSLKLLPFALRRIGKSFKTKHQKLDMEYKGFRYAGCEITEQEKEYLKNDLFVIKEALEIMFNEGHNKLTIGSCCLSEYKRIVGKSDWSTLFPDVYDMELDKKEHKYATVGHWLVKSYKGGWCYLVSGKENQIKYKGITADVNSLYPSMMSSESGNRYPYGKPTFWVGNFIPDKALMENRYFFVRIKTRFYLKKNMLPFIQIKGNMLYRPTEMLETSDVYNPKDGYYYDTYIDEHGNISDTRVELTLTMTDYYLILEHYELVDFEILDGCYFFAMTGIFDEYIEKYKKKKLVEKDAKRELAKLFLNNLYGKMASSPDSSFKVAFEKDDGSIGFLSVHEEAKQAGYIPVGSAITSYARNFTIRTAQQNYYGKDKAGFIYADTDSIHCDVPAEELKGLKVDDKNFCCWKLEASWDVAIFVRQKTYIEHVTHENLEPIDTPFYNIKCAGMPQKCKDLFEASMTNYDTDKNENNYTEDELEFISSKRTLEDFKIGLEVTGKLLPKRIRGGILLVETTYKMR